MKNIILVNNNYSKKKILGLTILERNIGTLSKNGISKIQIVDSDDKKVDYKKIERKYGVKIFKKSMKKIDAGNKTYVIIKNSLLLTDHYVKRITSDDRTNLVYCEGKDDVSFVTSGKSVSKLCDGSLSTVSNKKGWTKEDANNMIFVNSKESKQKAKMKIYYGLNKNTDIYEDKMTLIIRMIMLNTMLPVLLFFNIHPNLVSFFSLLSMICAGVIFSFGNYYLNLLAICFMIGGLAFDFSDGMVARFTNRPSKIGGWLEHTYDKISINILLFGITIGYFRNFGGYSWIWGLILVIGMNLISIVEKSFKEVFEIDINLIENNFKKNRKKKYMFIMAIRKLLFRTFLILLIGLFTNLVLYFIAVLSIVYIIYIIVFILVIVSVRKKL